MIAIEFLDLPSSPEVNVHRTGIVAVAPVLGSPDGRDWDLKIIEAEVARVARPGLAVLSGDELRTLSPVVEPVDFGAPLPLLVQPFASACTTFGETLFPGSRALTAAEQQQGAAARRALSRPSTRPITRRPTA